jgi:hypothetical protein
MVPIQVSTKPNDGLLLLEPQGHLNCIIPLAGGHIGLLGKINVEVLRGFSVEAIKTT